jgi:hypothetical protein
MLLYQASFPILYLAFQFGPYDSSCNHLFAIILESAVIVPLVRLPELPYLFTTPEIQSAWAQKHKSWP